MDLTFSETFKVLTEEQCIILAFILNLYLPKKVS